MDSHSASNSIVYGEDRPHSAGEPIYWTFHGSYALTIVAGAGFAILMFAHIAWTWRFKARKYWLQFDMAALQWVIRRFALMAYSTLRVLLSSPSAAGRPWGLMLFITVEINATLAATHLIAGLFLLFRRIVNWLGVQFSPFEGDRLFWSLVGAGILSTVLQGIGIGLYADGDQTMFIAGKALLFLGHLGMIALISTFLLWLSIFQRRTLVAGYLPTSVDLCLYVIKFSASLILLRTVYRCVRYLEVGRYSTMFASEVWDYCLDGVPVFIACLTTAILFPGQYIPRDPNERYADKPLMNSAADSREHLELTDV